MPAALLPVMQEMRRYRLPHTAKGWAMMLIIGVLVVAAEFLLKKFFPNIPDRWRTVIAVVGIIILLIVSGVDSEDLA